MKKRLKINGIIIFCAVLLVACLPRVFFHSKRAGLFEESAQVLGLALVLLGQIIRVSARGYKSENSQNSWALIQSGPYQVARNPMYLGISFIGTGVVLVLFNWWVALIFLAIFLIRYLPLIFTEEKKLSTMFGSEYAQYCKKVPRIFPSLLILSKLDISEYLPLKLGWFKRELNSISPLLFVILVLEAGEKIYRQGINAYLKQAPWLFLTIVVFIALVILLSKKTSKKRVLSQS